MSSFGPERQKMLGQVHVGAGIYSFGHGPFHNHPLHSHRRNHRLHLWPKPLLLGTLCILSKVLGSDSAFSN